MTSCFFCANSSIISKMCRDSKSLSQGTALPLLMAVVLLDSVPDSLSKCLCDISNLLLRHALWCLRAGGWRKVSTWWHPFRQCHQIPPTGKHQPERGPSNIQRHLWWWGKSGVPTKGEVLKPGGLLTSLGSGVEQPQLLVILAAQASRADWQWCTLKFCVGLQSGLDVVLHLFSVPSPLLGRTAGWNFLQLSVRQHAKEHWEGERGW